MKFSAKKNKNKLTVNVTMPKLETEEKVYKLYPTEVFNKYKDKYDIISYIKNPVLVASYKGESTAEFVFGIKSSSKKTSKSNLTEKTDDKIKLEKQITEQDSYDPTELLTGNKSEQDS